MAKGHNSGKITRDFLKNTQKIGFDSSIKSGRARGEKELSGRAEFKPTLLIKVSDEICRLA